MSWKKADPKARGKKEVYDEWEHGDIDRDEQKAGLKRRAKRWKQIELERKKSQALEKKAVDNAEKMGRDQSILLDPTPLEMAWLRCDFILSHIMNELAYRFMEWQRLNDPKCYKHLYRKFMSKAMMMNAQLYVDYFAKGGRAPKLITYPIIIRAYKNYYGIKTKFVVKHKNEEEYEL